MSSVAVSTSSSSSSSSSSSVSMGVEWDPLYPTIHMPLARAKIIIADTVIAAAARGYRSLSSPHEVDLSDQRVDLITKLITRPPKEDKGDLMLPAFQFIKRLGKLTPGGTPADIAGVIAAGLKDNLPMEIAKVVHDGAYVNFFLSPSFLGSSLIPHILSGAFLAPLPSAGRARVMIEYSQPNTHKAFHVGHMRNAALGDCLIRMYEQMGFPATAANYFGDEGAHVAKCLWILKRHLAANPSFDLESVAVAERGEWLGKMYSSAVEALSLSSYTSLPFPGILAGRVLSKSKHPNPAAPANWHLVTLDIGKAEPVTVVCGGVGYEVNDIVPYVPVGGKLKKKEGKGDVEVTPRDMMGVVSNGVMLSRKELGVEEDEETKWFDAVSDPTFKLRSDAQRAAFFSLFQSEVNKLTAQIAKQTAAAAAVSTPAAPTVNLHDLNKAIHYIVQNTANIFKQEEIDLATQLHHTLEQAASAAATAASSSSSSSSSSSAPAAKPGKEKSKEKADKAGGDGGDKDKKAKKQPVQQGGSSSSSSSSSGSGDNAIYLLPAMIKAGVELVEAGRFPGKLGDSLRILDVLDQNKKESKLILQQLEHGNEEMCALWRKTGDWSLTEFRKIYKWLGVRFDVEFFESQVSAPSLKMVREWYENDKKKGADETRCIIEDRGAIGCDLAKFGLGFCMLIKSNGSGLYATKDMSLAQRKFSEFHIDKSIYVVDAAQSLHFKQVFKTLELMGYKQAANCIHIAYGQVVLPSGKMSSRSGSVIFFSQLKNLLNTHIYDNFLKKYEVAASGSDEASKKVVEKWNGDEIAEAQQKIAVAAIKYGMLNHDVVKDIVFVLEEWTAMNGNTGPYMMYAYARIRSIVRATTVAADAQIDFSLLASTQERSGLLALAEFWNVVHAATSANNPSKLCDYVFDLAKAFSSFYETLSVKNAESENFKATRLAYINAIALTIKKGLDLLGISTLERM